MRPTFAFLSCLLIQTALSPLAAAQDEPIPTPSVKQRPTSSAQSNPRQAAPDETGHDDASPHEPEHDDASPHEAGHDDTSPHEAGPDQPAAQPATEQTATSSAAVAQLPSDEPSICTPLQIRTALERGREALVEVEAPMGFGLGFAFHSPEHVVTSMSLVEAGRGIEVVVDGSRRDAVVVAYDRARDLAILKLDRPLAREPLATAATALRVGDPLLAMGRSYDETDTVVIQPGTVTAVSEGGLRTDALDHAQMSWGGPLLDCQGRVVGVASSLWDSDAADAQRLLRIEKEIAEEAVYDGGWSVLHPSVGMLIQVDHAPKPGFGQPDAWVGISLGTALIGADRWFVPFRFDFSALAGPPQEGSLVERTGVRAQFETGIGYRAMLTGGQVPLYLVPQLGVSLGYDEIRTVETRMRPDASCADCYLSAVVSEQVDGLFRTMPTAGLGLMVGPGELSYKLHLDTQHVERSIHQITIGFQF